MKKDIAYIASAVGGRLSPSSDATRLINGFFSDSREPAEEKLYLAIRGERVDGNSFVPELLKNGFCALADREECVPDYGTCIIVDDVRDALQRLAKFYRETELENIPFVGITGSVGKTTTKEMVALALSSSLSVHKTKGNFNSQIGLPQTVLACEKSADCAVVELGMSYAGEMERISRCAMPDISIITNIGYSHIENLGSRESIRDEKLKISKFSSPESCLLLNGEEPLLRNVDFGSKKSYYVSVDDASCDCYAKNINETAFDVTFIAVVFGEEFNVQLPVRGRHFVINALFALATASLLKIDVSAAARAMSNYVSDGKRQHIYESNGHTVISDCYNASPESMQAALSVLSSSKGRRIAVLGDMLELGAESESLHKSVGEYVRDSADVLVTYGEMAKYIASTARLSETYSFSVGEMENLREFLKAYLKDGDTVLYKASNGMRLSVAIV